MKIQKGDNVEVVAGAAKGTQGKVLEFFPSLNRVVVEGVGAHTHRQKTPEGKIEEVEEFRAIDISNVMVVDPKDNKPTRIGIQRDGKKIIRVAKRSGAELK